MAKHFALDITDTSFSFARKTDEITVEAALDGLCVVRTSLPAAALDDTATVRSYKSLSLVELAASRANLANRIQQHCGTGI
jgi:hypothetical protein